MKRKNPPHTFRESQTGIFYYERIIKGKRFRKSLHTKFANEARSKAKAIDNELDKQIDGLKVFQWNYELNPSVENLTKMSFYEGVVLEHFTGKPRPPLKVGQSPATDAISLDEMYASYFVTQTGKEVGANALAKKYRIKDILIKELEIEDTTQLVTQGTINRFKSYMTEKGYSPDTRNTYLKELRTVFNWLSKQDYISTLTIEKLEFGRQTNPRVRDFTLSKEEVFTVIAGIGEKLYSLYFKTLWYVCGRPSEIIALKPLNLDLDKLEVSYMQDKTEKDKTVTVPTDLMKELSAYIMDNKIGESDRLFPGLTAERVRKAWQAACKVAGIELPAGIGAYVIRHSRVTDIALKSNTNVKLIELYSGDKPETALKHYTNTKKDDFKDIMAAIDGE